MASCLLSGFLGFVMVNMLFASARGQVAFSQNYNVAYGNDHFSSLDNGNQVQLSLDQTSGAGFESKSQFLSGLFSMKVKIPEQQSPGVITTFYLTSKAAQHDEHDELDFEFIGTSGPPYALSTNIFTKGVGGREQKFNLWFNPSGDFHSYTLLWNKYQVVFYVDDTPIRVFKNLGNESSYPTQGMQVKGTLWEATWAGQVDWSKAPFTAQYQGFDINACAVSDPSDAGKCNYTQGNAAMTWAQNQTLDAAQMAQYQNARSNYLTYDYCTDKAKHATPPPECQAPTGI